MKTQHTPGPWRIQMSCTGAVRHLQILSDKHSIATPAFAADLSTEELVANARLIAAAPDLLEAAKRAAEALGALLSHSIPALDLLHAAIAKAEERASADPVKPPRINRPDLIVDLEEGNAQ